MSLHPEQHAGPADPDDTSISREADPAGLPGGGRRGSTAPVGFLNVVAAAQAGDVTAVAWLIEEHGDDLLKVVRRRMPRRLRTMFDSQDFVQAFWATFFAHGITGAKFDSPSDLRAYLCTVAANRVTDQIRRRLVRPTKNLNRERPLTAEVAATRQSRAETPSQVAIARERMDDLLQGQPNHHRQVIELKAAGATNAEIAAAVGLNEGSVRRVLTKAATRVRTP